MARKTYRAYGSIVSLGLFVNGCNIRVSFTPVSNYEAGKGGSEFVTEDEEIQKALESRGDFGRLFVLESVEDEHAEEVQDTLVEMKHVQVNGLADAREWLKEHHGWEPTGRPTKANIMRVAEEYGVRFEGLE